MNFYTGFHSWWVLCADVEDKNWRLSPGDMTCQGFGWDVGNISTSNSQIICLYSWKMLKIIFTENMNEITRCIGVIGCISFARRGAPIKVWLYLWLIEMPNQFPCCLFTPCNFVRTLIFSKHRKLQLRFTSSIKRRVSQNFFNIS